MRAPLDYNAIWQHFRGVVAAFASSEAGPQAKRLFTALVMLLLAVSGFNVLASYAGRYFMTALAERDTSVFAVAASLYATALVIITIVAALFRYVEERLGLLWREWLTRKIVDIYLSDTTYFRLQANGEIDNPDERIADDVRTFTTTTLSFLLLILNGTITTLAFSGVLWSISPTLFWVAVLYACLGTYLAVWLGRPLVGLHFDQIEREANFRADLVCVRTHAEAIALSHREQRLLRRLHSRLEALASNFAKIISLNRNLGFFTTGYNQLTQIIPVVIVAPLFMRGAIDFGSVTQSSMAFAHLLGAFSLIVTQFQSISSFTAVIARLGTFASALNVAADSNSIKVLENEILTFKNLCLRAQKDNRVLIDNLSVEIPHKSRVLVLAAHGTAKVALFRATAGIWETGQGTILRPHTDMLFLPERPYLPPGTLREFFAQNGDSVSTDERQASALIDYFGLTQVIERAGGLDREQDWASLLSLSDQQRLAIIRILLIKPRYVFLDRIGTLLPQAQLAEAFNMLQQYDISYLTLGAPEDSTAFYNAILRIAADGTYEWSTLT